MTRNELNQKVDAFFSKYQGQTKGYPTDGQYNGECLSIAKLYIKEVFGFDPPSSGVNSAYGYWTNFPSPLGDYFDKVENTPTGVPSKGSIPIWNAKLAGSKGYGHIDIATGGGDTNNFVGMDQNWGGKQFHRQSHDYTNLYGWLTPKLTVDAPAPTPSADPKDQQIKDLQSKLEASELTDKKLSAQVVEFQERVNVLANDKNALESNVASSKDQLNKLTTDIALAQSTIKELQSTNLELMARVGGLSKPLTDEDRKQITLEYIKNIFIKIFKK